MATSAIPEQLLSKEQTAVYLGISGPTIDRLIKSGELNPIRFGRSVRFTKQILEDFQQQKSTTSETKA